MCSCMLVCVCAFVHIRIYECVCVLECVLYSSFLRKLFCVLEGASMTDVFMLMFDRSVCMSMCVSEYV